jgi:hypothetical protein
MANNAPYYPIHKIETGKYTAGGELVTDDINQTDYIGLYHILPNGEYWSNASPRGDSVRLILKRLSVSPDVKRYNLIRNKLPANYVSPVSYHPILNASDYEIGYVMRYFVQKRNNPYVTIQEIDSGQYTTLNQSNRPGISTLLWNYIEIKWTLTGVYALQLNNQEIQRAESSGFVNLKNYLKDPLEFWK